jgi:hypothetical protein
MGIRSSSSSQHAGASDASADVLPVLRQNESMSMM